MEFLDEEARPRFLLQTRISSAPTPNPETPKLNKTLALCCSSTSISLLFLAFFYLSDSQTLQFLLFWISFSLLLGPFAPISATGGDISVGKGDLLLLQPSDPDPIPVDEPKKRISGRRSKPRRPDDHPSPNSPFQIAESEKPEPKIVGNSTVSNGESRSEVEEEKEWTDEDFELLKKQIAKHPVGAPRRWEAIAEAFRGRHGLESVIRTAKSMAEKRPGGGDSFAQFLKQRKPLSKQLEGDVNGELGSQSVVSGENGDLKESGSSIWTSGEDIALLNALKAFPKDVPMRWEKIAAAVPGKSKACCVKRVAELKRDFRSSKASEGT